MTDTHPSVAHRVVCVDFDGTIRPWGGLFADEPPFPGVAEAMAALHEAGYRVVIFTSRLSATWWRADFEPNGFPDAGLFGSTNIQYVGEYLMRHGIYFDALTAEKIPAEVYIDDRAVRVDAGSLPAAIHDFLRGAA